MHCQAECFAMFPMKEIHMKPLIRGQKCKLSDLTSVTTLHVGIAVSGGAGQVFDCSCFGVDANDQLSDDRYFIFYNQKSSPCGSLVSMGKQGSDVETFRVDLANLSGGIQKLVFTISIDGPGTMCQVSSGHIRLCVGSEELARFSFTGGDFALEKALIAGELYRKDGWRFSATGQGFNGGISALLKHFGGEEIAPGAAAPPPPPEPTPKPAPPPQTVTDRAVPPIPAAPAAPPSGTPVRLSKVTLEKRGDRKVVDLRKGGGRQPIHINLNWEQLSEKSAWLPWRKKEADLDLGCMVRLKDGDMTVIQPLGGNFGAKDRPPHIFLDRDDRSGAAADGENLYIYRPDLIDMVMVFALVYEGARDFSAVAGRVLIRDQEGNEITINLNSPDPKRQFCAVCTIRNVGTCIEIEKEERYFSDHERADRHYGFGFRWTAGRK
jgi:tellurite resistance protein TerA